MASSFLPSVRQLKAALNPRLLPPNCWDCKYMPPHPDIISLLISVRNPQTKVTNSLRGASHRDWNDVRGQDLICC